MSVEVLSNLLSSRLGLELEQAPPDFLPAFRAAATRQRVSVDELARRADERLWMDWIPRLTVPETCFFRHRGQLDRLRMAILPSLDGVRGVRLWSAGCCTGEEAYTLALLAHHRGWTDYSVLGTDLNVASLVHARDAIYTAHAVREGGREYLTARPDGRFEVRPEIRQRVTFERANLLDGPRPGQHVILCRNVLIYLTPAARRQLLGHLAQSLVTGGVLLVSPCEGAGLEHPLLEREVTAQGLLFRRSQAPRPASGPEPAPAPSACVPPAPPAPAPPVPSPLEQARSLADGGHYREAEQLCREGLSRDARDLSAHFLLAQLAELQGDRHGCRSRLEHILELDSQAAGALLELAELCRAEGDDLRARRLRAAARETLGNLPPERPVEPYGRPARTLLAELG